MPLRRKSRSSRSLLWLWLGEGLNDLFSIKGPKVSLLLETCLITLWKKCTYRLHAYCPEHEAEVQEVLKNGWICFSIYSGTTRLRSSETM